MTNKTSILQSFNYFYKHLGLHVFTLLLISLLVGVLDGLGLTMFFPILKLASNGEQPGAVDFGNFDFLLKIYSFLGVEPKLTLIVVMMLLFFVFKGVATFVNEYFRIVLEQKFLRRLRQNLVELLNNTSFKYFVQADVGMIQNNMTGEAGRLVAAYTSLFNFLQQMVLVLVYVVFAFVINPVFTIYVALGSFLTSLIFKKLYKFTESISAQLTKRTHSFQGLIIQHIGNFKYLKATGALSVFGLKLNNAVLAIEESNKKIGLLKGVLQASREPLMIITISATIFIQSKFVSLDVPNILICLVFFYRSLSYLLIGQTQLNQFFSVSGSFENIKLFQLDLLSNREEPGELEYIQLKHSVRLENISLNYGTREVLGNINLTIPKNGTIALVGESGSGKTSLINLISGLITPSTGNIFVDNVDLRLLNKIQYQNKVGYITQEPAIFNDTIFNNVTFWDEKTAENLNRFKHVTTLANIHDFVFGLADKENTSLGFNGINISGGQKQRLSIARELYKNIDILILDEATSALDSESELMIKQNIESLKGKITIIMVAHRLSTIKSADKIVFIRNGSVAFEGDFEKLKSTVPDFRRMIELQEL